MTKISKSSQRSTGKFKAVFGYFLKREKKLSDFVDFSADHVTALWPETLSSTGFGILLPVAVGLLLGNNGSLPLWGVCFALVSTVMSMQCSLPPDGARGDFSWGSIVDTGMSFVFRYSAASLASTWLLYSIIHQWSSSMELSEEGILPDCK